MNSIFKRIFKRTLKRSLLRAAPALLALVLVHGFGASGLVPLALASEISSEPLGVVAVYPEQRAPARVVALDSTRLHAEVGGRVLALTAELGASVAAGAELVRLDDADYRIALAQARAQAGLIARRIALAHTQLEQSRALSAKGFSSADALRVRETEVAVIEAELELARQGVAAAELALARTRIRAPFAGVVSERLASVGDLAGPGLPLLSLVGSERIEVRARVPASLAPSLRSGTDWRLRAHGEEYALELVRISPVVEAAGQAQEAVLRAAAGAAPLAPGLAGELRWRSAQPHLPPEFVQQRGEVLGSFVLQDGKLEFRGLSQAERGRPVGVDWPLETRLVGEERYTLEAPALDAPMLEAPALETPVPEVQAEGRP